MENLDDCVAQETKEELELFFDTETSDLINFKSHDSDPKQPWIVQLAAVLGTKDKVHMTMNLIIQSCNLPMSKTAENTHGISVKFADEYGYHPGYAFNLFHSLCTRADKIICHNYAFDMRMVAILAKRMKDVSSDDSIHMLDMIKGVDKQCTMADRKVVDMCMLPFPSGRSGNKWPKLEELHEILFNEKFEGAHDALNDVHATRRCYYELKDRGIL